MDRKQIYNLRYEVLWPDLCLCNLVGCSITGESVSMEVTSHLIHSPRKRKEREETRTVQRTHRIQVQAYLQHHQAVIQYVHLQHLSAYLQIIYALIPFSCCCCPLRCAWGGCPLFRGCPLGGCALPLAPLTCGGGGTGPNGFLA